MATEYEIAVLDMTAAFADACNTVQMTPEELQQVQKAAVPSNLTNSPTANINAKPTGIHSPETIADTVERIGYDVSAAQPPPPQTGSILSEGLGVACNAMSMKMDYPKELMAANNMNTNPSSENLKTHGRDEQAELDPDNTKHLNADLNLNQPTLSYQPSMMG